MQHQQQQPESSALKDTIERLLSGEDEHTSRAVSLLKKILGNVPQHHNDATYRHINTHAAVMKTILLPCPGALQVLNEAGFVEPNEEMIRELDEKTQALVKRTPHLVLRECDEARCANVLKALLHAELGKPQPQPWQKFEDPCRHFERDYQQLRKHMKKHDPLRDDILKKIERAKHERSRSPPLSRDV